MTATPKHGDQDMENAIVALRRAAQRARKLARDTGTAIVVVRDGKLVKEVPPAVENENAEP